MLSVCLVDWVYICHIGGHCVRALAYADDVTLVAPNLSGIRTLINIFEQFVFDYDITFNGTKCKLLFLKVDFLMVLLVAFMLMDNILEVSKCVMHLGHTKSSGNRTEIVKYA